MRRSEAEHNRHLPLSRRHLPTRLVDRLPLLPRPEYPVWTRHPVPVALSEVSKLCGVVEPEAVGDTEAMSTLGPWPVTITDPIDHHPGPFDAETVAALSELNPAVKRVLSGVLDLALELIGPAEEVDGGLVGLHPGDLPARSSVDHQRDVLIRFRSVIRDRLDAR